MTVPRCSLYVVLALAACLAASPGYSLAAASEGAWKSSFSAGVAARKAAQYHDAEQLLDKAISQAEALDPQGDQLVRSLNELGLVLRLVDRLDAARETHDRALSIAEATHGKDSPDAASAVYGLAVVANLQGKADEAERLFQRALATREKALGINNVIVARTLYGYASFKMGQQDFGQARSMLTRALGIFEKDSGEDPELRALTLAGLGKLYEQQNNVPGASNAYERALKEGEQVLPDAHPTLAWIRAEVAEFKFGVNDTLAAVALFEKAIPVLASAEGANELQVAIYKADLAGLYVEQQRWAEAERTYGEALPILQKSADKDDPTLKDALADYSELKRFNAAQRSGSAPQYETRYANGSIVWVGKSGGLEVRLSAEMSDDLALILYVVNDTDQPMTFYPEQVRVEAVRRKNGVATREPVRMFPADEYVSRLNTSLAWKSLFAGMGNYQEPKPQTYTTSSRTDARAYDWSSGTTVTGSSTSSGTVTKEVTDADRQVAQDRARAKTQSELAPQEARARAVAAGLMRTQTLDPHMGYGGTVFAKSKGKEYVATVPFGDTAFQFNFKFK